MSLWIYINLAAFLIVAGMAGFIIPKILLIAFRKKLFDEIDERKIHKGTVPRLGGIAFFPCILFAFFLVTALGCHYAPDMVWEAFRENPMGFSLIACAVIILYLVGLADDLVGVKYRAKFMAQAISSLFVVVGGIQFADLHGFLGIHAMPAVVVFALSIVLMVFIINAINLIDGIDGLASGLSAIACMFYGFIFFTIGLHIYGLLAFATLGALLPFFYYNVFGDAKRHKKIFMGDTGALTIGLLLSVFSIRISQIDDSEIGVNTAVVAFAPLMIPCLDVLRVYIHRIRNHHSPFLPDKNHIHHKLLALGMGHRTVMMSIVLGSILLIILNYWLSCYIGITLLFAIDVALWTVANILLTKKGKR